MSTPLPRWEGLHTIGSSAIGIGVDSGAFKYIPAGDYYWQSVADGGSVSLISALQTLLTSAPNAVAASTATISDTGGIITITWGSGSHSVQFANAASRARFGAPGNLLAFSGSAQLSQQAKGVWLPNVPGSNNGSVAGPGLPESDRKVTISQSGAVWATSSAERRRARWQFKGLTKDRMLTADEVLVNTSLETFWRDVLNTRGGIFRHHPDRTNDASYTTWQSVMTSGLRPTRFKSAYDAVWDSGEMETMEYVHVATGGGF